MLYINSDGVLDDGPASTELARANLLAVRNGEIPDRTTADRLLADAVLHLTEE